MKIAVLCVLVFAFLAVSQATPIETIENNVAQMENELVNTFCGPQDQAASDQDPQVAAQKTGGKDAKVKGKRGGNKGGKNKGGKGKSTTESP